MSIRRRALDLLFTMADAGNAPAVVDELVKYLTVAGDWVSARARKAACCAAVRHLAARCCGVAHHDSPAMTHPR